ncbi:MULTISPECIES: EamA family transporter [unclassified Gilliamella]|uniref:EamA family transporter n=1 Tax=unclassified Gilliamella TaxID=2685620 RepID=UPI001C6A74D0|nr:MULTISPECIES: DMT family transporter [unclassified Gilliamella]MCX8600954.1 DMT family transporter [Gilliamella sp. B3722]MCX8607517.1 DMT family transporter [Gilliamella sp. B3771]MCX8610176.1 DMT family transporter [Gilliamella sp. B3891]MCX8612564.1 DMT family transporter [Gilliamella sp. B3773]MCX8616712.1 DMT family transporter [Gilliamella sp. B3770]
MKEKFLGGLLVFLGACSFGVLSSIVKTAYKAGYSLGEVTGVQCFLGMLILWGIHLIVKTLHKSKSNSEKELNQPLTKKWKVCAVGIFPGLVGICYYQCVQLVPASIAIILLMQYLWISVIIDFVIFKNKPSFIQIVTVIVIIVGSALAAGIFNEDIRLNLFGCMFGLLAAIMYSLFITTSSNIGNELPKLEKSALMITGACIVTFLIFPPMFFFKINIHDQLYQLGFLLALLGTVLPPFLFSVGIPKIGISFSAILSAAELPVAVTCSYFYLKESVYFNQWVGVLIILLAIALPNLIHIKKRP